MRAAQGRDPARHTLLACCAMRSVKRVNRVLGMLLSSTLMLAASGGCGGDDSDEGSVDGGGGAGADGGAGGTGADAGSAGGECGEPVTCSALSEVPGWSDGTKEIVPADFPAAPPGATLCGESEKLLTAYWTIGDDSTVHAHYEAELIAAGWTVDGPVADAMTLPCDTVQYMSMGAASVQVYVWGSKGAFALTFQPAP